MKKTLQEEKQRILEIFQNIDETYIQGPGGHIENVGNQTPMEKFIYRVKELSWIQQRIMLYLDTITEEDINKHYETLSNAINQLHSIINDIRDKPSEDPESFPSDFTDSTGP